MHRAGDVAQGAQVVPGVVAGELGGEALPEQPGAGRLGGVGRVDAAGGRVEVGQGLPGQRGIGLEALRGEVGLPVVLQVEPETHRQVRVVGHESVEIGVGDLPRGA